MAIILNSAKNHPLVATVMVIDDQLTSRVIFETVLQSIGDNIKVKCYDNALSALKTVQTEPPDLIITDYKMPELDGVEFIRRLRKIPSCHDIPVVIITIIDERSVMYEALEAGATDFLTKPVDHYECKVRCRNLLTMRRQQLIIRDRATSQEEQVNDAIENFHTREKDILTRFANITNFRDNITRTQNNHIGKISRIIAGDLGMDQDFCDIIEFAAPLHNIGYIGISEKILSKESEASPEDLEVLKTHTSIGYEILKDSSSPHLQMGATIALHHHEQFDGKGYPHGLSGEEIPVEAKIVTTADIFTSLTTSVTDREQEHPMSVDESVNEITQQAGKSLDPVCVDALLNQLDEILACQDTLSKNSTNNH